MAKKRKLGAQPYNVNKQSKRAYDACMSGIKNTPSNRTKCAKKTGADVEVIKKKPKKLDPMLREDIWLGEPDNLDDKG